MKAEISEKVALSTDVSGVGAAASEQAGAINEKIEIANQVDVIVDSLKALKTNDLRGAAVAFGDQTIELLTSVLVATQPKAAEALQSIVGLTESSVILGEIFANREDASVAERNLSEVVTALNSVIADDKVYRLAHPDSPPSDSDIDDRTSWASLFPDDLESLTPAQISTLISQLAQSITFIQSQSMAKPNQQQLQIPVGGVQASTVPGTVAPLRLSSTPTATSNNNGPSPSAIATHNAAVAACKSAYNAALNALESSPSWLSSVFAGFNQMLQLINTESSCENKAQAQLDASTTKSAPLTPSKGSSQQDATHIKAPQSTTLKLSNQVSSANPITTATSASKTPASISSATSSSLRQAAQPAVQTATRQIPPVPAANLLAAPTAQSIAHAQSTLKRMPQSPVQTSTRQIAPVTAAANLPAASTAQSIARAQSTLKRTPQSPVQTSTRQITPFTAAANLPAAPTYTTYPTALLNYTPYIPPPVTVPRFEPIHIQEAYMPPPARLMPPPAPLLEQAIAPVPASAYMHPLVPVKLETSEPIRTVAPTREATHSARTVGRYTTGAPIYTVPRPASAHVSAPVHISAPVHK